MQLPHCNSHSVACEEWLDVTMKSGETTAQRTFRKEPGTDSSIFLKKGQRFFVGFPVCLIDHHHNHHPLSRISPLDVFRFRIYFLKLMNLLNSW
jgi:hypothetical protein